MTPDDIRLVYIGSAHKAVHYARGHVVPEPRPDQILVVLTHEPLLDIPVGALPYWCHIATELHVTATESRPAVADAIGLFNDVKARRQPPPRKAGV